jgi:hypothetical protein
MGTRGKAAGAWSWLLIPSTGEVKEWMELYLHSPNTPSWRGAQLKHRDNFTFTLTIFSQLNIPKTGFRPLSNMGPYGIKANETYKW